MSTFETSADRYFGAVDKIARDPKNATGEAVYENFELMAYKIARKWPSSGSLTQEDMVQDMLSHLWIQLHRGKFDPYNYFEKTAREPGALLNKWAHRVMASHCARVNKQNSWRGFGFLVGPDGEFLLDEEGNPTTKRNEVADPDQERRMHSLEAMTGFEAAEDDPYEELV